MTIGAALDEWLEDKRQAGIKPLSIATQDGRLRPFLPLEATLGDFTPQRAAKLYLDETKREGRFGVLRASTHQKTLSFAKGFFSWAVERGYIKENPFTRIKPIGRANAGKTQLREDEAADTCAAVARALGHGSDAVTPEHYITPTALEDARTAAVASMLLGSDLSAIVTTLRGLTREELDSVCSTVGYERKVH